MTPSRPTCNCGSTRDGMLFIQSRWWCLDCIKAALGERDYLAAEVERLKPVIETVGHFLVAFHAHSARSAVSGDAYARLEGLYRMLHPKWSKEAIKQKAAEAAKDKE